MHLNASKLVQAAGVLLRCDSCAQMSYLRLLKLLYIAERESLAETGYEIIGDRVVAMKNGPVLSRTLDTIEGETTESTIWNRFIRREHYQIRLENDPGVGKLCPYEIRKLKEVSSRYEGFSDWDIVEVTHTFGEWIKNFPGGCGAAPIPLEDILAAVGRADDAADIKANIEGFYALDIAVRLTA